MLVGFAAAAFGFQVSFVEPAIWSSIIILGLLVALAVKGPTWLGAAVVGLFAFFHGQVHGTEATTPTLISYAVGFALATGAVHAAGIGLGLLAESAIGKVALRAIGGLAVLGGVALMTGPT
jgi:urease accessory protein